MSVKITDKITQMNGQNYPLMDASAVEYTKPDGTKVDCIVGAVVDYSQEYKGNVSFIVNNTWNAQGTNNLTFDLKNIKIMNNGQYIPKKG